jgi:hypothetical protein
MVLEYAVIQVGGLLFLAMEGSWRVGAANQIRTPPLNFRRRQGRFSGRTRFGVKTNLTSETAHLAPLLSDPQTISIGRCCRGAADSHTVSLRPELARVYNQHNG